MPKKIVALLFFLMIVDGGCAGSSVLQELPQYASAPSTDRMLSQISVSVSDEQALNEFLSEVANAAMRHDWRSVAYVFDPVGYAEQFAFMKGDNTDRSDADVVAQILRETLGLGMVDNNLSGTGGTYNQPFARLNRIQQVELTGVDPPGNEFRQVDGIVTLEDGSTRSLSFSVMMGSDGEWLIVVPMG